MPARPRNVDHILRDLEWRTTELYRGIADGSFYRRSYWRRYLLVRRITRLYRRLVGAVELKPYLAATSMLLLAAGCKVTTFFGYEVDLIAFESAQQNPFGLAGAYYMAFPTLADIDGDGDLDVIVGEGRDYDYPYYSDIVYYENVGSAEEMVLAAPVTDEFGLGYLMKYMAIPAFVDIDADGDLDLFMGGDTYVYSGFTGYINFFENTGTATSPDFTAVPWDPHAFGLTGVPYMAWPTFADIDADGDYDLFAGDVDGHVHFFENTGTADAPAFAAPQVDPFGLTDVGFYAAPAFADTDADGDLDALVGRGYDTVNDLYYFENTGSPTEPAFESPVTNPFGLGPSAYSGRATFADIDADGDADLFVGEGHLYTGGYTGNILFYENVTLPP